VWFFQNPGVQPSAQHGTVISCVQEAELPLQSVAVKVRVMTKGVGHTAPFEASLQVIAGGSQASEAIASLGLHAGTVAPHANVTAAGQVIVGGVVSITSTVRLQEAVLPEQSVAVQVRVTL